MDALDAVLAQRRVFAAVFAGAATLASLSDARTFVALAALASAVAHVALTKDALFVEPRATEKRLATAFSLLLFISATHLVYVLLLASAVAAVAACGFAAALSFAVT